MPDDAELLRRYAKDKSEEAFAELVRRHLNLVYAVALRQVGGDAHLAQDVAQTVFTALARKATALARRPVLGGWLYRTAQYAAIDVVRAETRRRAREQEAQMIHEDDNNPETAPDWEKLRGVLDHILSELRDGDRDAVVLRFFEGKSYADMGACIWLSENGARMRVERALEKLRVALGRRGITSTTGALGVALANQVAVAAPAGLAATVTGSVLARATASAGTAAVAAFFTTMSTTKTITVITGIVALFSICTAIYEVGRSRAAESALAARNSETDALRARLVRSDKELRTTEMNLADLRKENDRIHVATAAAKPADLTARHEEVIDRLVVNNPELRKLYARQQTIRFRVRYGPLYRTFGLTPEQVGAFERIRSDNVLAQSDVFKEGLAQGLAKSDPIVQDLIKQVNQRQEDNLRALLGAEGVQQLQTYERTLPLRNVANTLADSVYFTDTPLTPKQADQLTQVVVESMSMPPGSNTLGAINWEKVLAKAPTVLTPVQLEALSTMVEQAEVGKKVYAIVEPALNSQGLSVQDNLPTPTISSGKK